MQGKNVAIARVRLDESENECTMCGVCEAACPEIFEVPEKVIIKEGADFGLVEEAIEEVVIVVRKLMRKLKKLLS